MGNKKCLKPPTSICILYGYVFIYHNPHWRFKNMFLRFTNSSNYDGTIIPLLSHYNPNQSVNLPLLLLASPGFPTCLCCHPSSSRGCVHVDSAVASWKKQAMGKEKRVENQQILEFLGQKNMVWFFKLKFVRQTWIWPPNLGSRGSWIPRKIISSFPELEIIQRMRSVCFILTYFVNVGESK